MILGKLYMFACLIKTNQKLTDEKKVVHFFVLPFFSLQQTFEEMSHRITIIHVVVVFYETLVKK